MLTTSNEICIEEHRRLRYYYFAFALNPYATYTTTNATAASPTL
jgi:hypothetical protein